MFLVSILRKPHWSPGIQGHPSGEKELESPTQVNAHFLHHLENHYWKQIGFSHFWHLWVHGLQATLCGCTLSLDISCFTEFKLAGSLTRTLNYRSRWESKKKNFIPHSQCFTGKWSLCKYTPETPIFRSLHWLPCVLRIQPGSPDHSVCGYTAVASIKESPPSNLNWASSWFGRKFMQFTDLKHFLHPRGQTRVGGKGVRNC